MFVLDCTINIGEYTFKRVNDIKIVKSVDLLSDTAMIKMPASAVFLSNTNGEERKQLEEELKAGMPVEITLSYKDVFEKKEFTGYVTHIEPRNHMVTIECEDVLYHVRKTRINKNFKETTLKEVLTHIISETNKKLPENATPVKLASNIADINFDNLPLKDKNGAQALKKIVDDYNLRVFINDKDELYGGLRLTTNINESSTYNLQTNVVKHNLKYTKEEDVNLYVKVIGVKKDNTKVEVIVGDKEEGEQRTLHYYNISDEEKLKEIGESELENIKYSGYRGNLTGFLVPHTTRGMKVEIIDEKYPSRNGTYFVPKVTTHFGQSGARRKVELGAII
ncbi:late control protein [uncultured Tenacibaculum sp.]|uniref:late control protein n=1 Tax=uncultured Tenacibaculum sp. TaxID=174713 RepID=UPI0026150AFB|nr:late control protein [uncultured Tenacibaculum sp.]